MGQTYQYISLLLLFNYFFIYFVLIDFPAYHRSRKLQSSSLEEYHHQITSYVSKRYFYTYFINIYVGCIYIMLLLYISRCSCLDVDVSC